MGLLEQDVGHGGRDRKSRLNDLPKAITVRSLRQARAAAAAAAKTGTPVLLLSAPGAAASVGPSWFSAVVANAAADFPDAEILPVLDCGTMPGYALAALRHGLPAVRYDGPSIEAIADIAEQYEAALLRERPEALDLSDLDAGGDRPEALVESCCAWLSARG